MRQELRNIGAACAGASAATGHGTSASTGSRDETVRARAIQYLLLATLFARAPSAGLLRDISNLQGDASPLGLAQLALADAARAAEPSDVATEYLNLFIGVGRGDILPYGSFYLTGFLHERPLARVREDMAKLGLERQGGVFEPEDHITSLFEIMAGLVGGSFGTPAKAGDKFFERHIEPWAPRLMADVAAAPSARFYRHVARLGAVWIEIEQEAVRLPE